MPLAVFFFSILSAPTALSEYRVYQYEIIPPNGTRPEEGYVVTDTLDPTSFPAYHGGQASSEIRLLRTWMCRGFTGEHRSHCRSPEKNLPPIGNAP